MRVKESVQIYFALKNIRIAFACNGNNEITKGISKAWIIIAGITVAIKNSAVISVRKRQEQLHLFLFF